MDLPAEQVDALKRHCGGVGVSAEGSATYVLLTGLRLPPGASPTTLDALLRFGDRGDGYPNRLYFAQRVTPASRIALNWNAVDVHVLGRNWSAYSWKAAPELPAEDILLEHLKALR